MSEKSMAAKVSRHGRNVVVEEREVVASVYLE